MSQASLPGADFGTFIISLASSVLIHLGELPDPDRGGPQADLELAKQSLDVLGMLREKTRGNLTAEEAQLLDQLLYDLRMKYLAKKG